MGAGEFQADRRVRLWGYIPALGRWLRVVTLEDAETVHNAWEATPGVVLDFDAAGALVGIDIDRASLHLDLASLRTGSVPVEGADSRAG